MRPLTAAPVVLLLGFAAAARAQQGDLAGRDQYPQFRVLSGLPGGGFGVMPNGKPSIDGAAALATPIGYTLGGHGAVGLFNTGSNGNPFLFDGLRPKEQNSNGTLQLMGGGSYAGFRGSASYMVLSARLDSVFNFQVSPPLKGPIGVSFGVQDLNGDGGAAGTSVGNGADYRSSRSVYAVGTYSLKNRAYVSLGVGDRRFRGVFGNASAPLGNQVRAVVEYDAFNFNLGLIYNPGRLDILEGKAGNIEPNFFLGLVRGKYATVGLTLTL